MNSDYIRSLPPQVKKRINALKNLQKKHMETEVEFHKEFHMLELKYQEKMAELTQQVTHQIHRVLFSELNLDIIHSEKEGCSRWVWADWNWMRMELWRGGRRWRKPSKDRRSEWKIWWSQRWNFKYWNGLFSIEYGWNSHLEPTLTTISNRREFLISGWQFSNPRHQSIKQSRTTMSQFLKRSKISDANSLKTLIRWLLPSVRTRITGSNDVTACQYW